MDIIAYLTPENATKFVVLCASVFTTFQLFKKIHSKELNNFEQTINSQKSFYVRTNGKF